MLLSAISVLAGTSCKEHLHADLVVFGSSVAHRTSQLIPFVDIHIGFDEYLHNMMSRLHNIKTKGRPVMRISSINISPSLDEFFHKLKVAQVDCQLKR